MNRHDSPQIIVCIAILALAPLCRADVTLPAIFSENMVVQREEDINVWGKADPSESVTVRLGPDTQQTSAGEDGTWSVKLDGLRAGGPYDLTVSGKNSITVRNVAIGEVWLCSGESNMEFKVMAARNGREEIAEAHLPMVRVFTVKHNAAEKPAADCEGTWTVCNPATVKDFSAVAYFFAHELNPAMRMPMGLIQSAWGPSPVEAWMPHATLDKDPVLRAAVDRYAKAIVEYPGALASYQAKLETWKAEAEAAKAAGSPAPHAPLEPLTPGGQREPSALYNGMIHPLLHFPIRGVLWYQGESNTSEAGLYGKLFPALIGAWRNGWDEGDMPFFYVQLSGFLGRHAEPMESRWAELREAQAQTLSVPRTGMVVSADLGEDHDMHPADKQDVAHRLVLLSENEVYGKKAPASGPVFAGMQVGDGKATLSFTHEEGGLVARNGTPLKGFEIAGEDRKFVWANAEIRGEKVIVQSKDVPKPVAVRYAWANNPECDLFNKAHLPASPFRTDNWVVGEEAVAASPTPMASPAKTHKHHSVAKE